MGTREEEVEKNIARARNREFSRAKV